MVGSVGMGGMMPFMGGHRSMSPPSFARMDANGDGGITLDEFSAIGKNRPGAAKSADSSETEALFKKIDADGGGDISSAELSTFQSKMSETMQSFMLRMQESAKTSDAGNGLEVIGQRPSPDDIFAKMDSDGDGAVSKDEFASAMGAHSNQSSDQAAALFDKIDTDDDGSISKAENQAFAEQARGSRHAASPGDLLEALLEAMDSDKDGSVSADEGQAFAKKLSNLGSQSDGVSNSSPSAAAARSYGAASNAHGGQDLISKLLQGLTA